MTRSRADHLAFASLPVLLCSASARSLPDSVLETITGRVVAVADGDTITVLQDHEQYGIRLYGVDCPEERQPFGTWAKQFTTDLGFGHDVTVQMRDVGRYG